MINLILSTYAKLLEQYIGSYVHQPEGLVEVGVLGAQGDEAPCKVLLSLLSVECESAHGVVSGKVASSGHLTAISSPLLFANLNIIIAAVFSEKRYKESLSFSLFYRILLCLLPLKVIDIR